ncbi:hypothetical protein [Oceanobacillus oncorhynchi]|uniref:hypothetical protein n=1 Tax=Oceanobacillus oncorhynchi TaxID=545501 RepID=UPI0034D52EB3
MKLKKLVGRMILKGLHEYTISVVLNVKGVESTLRVIRFGEVDYGLKILTLELEKINDFGIVKELPYMECNELYTYFMMKYCPSDLTFNVLIEDYSKGGYIAKRFEVKRVSKIDKDRKEIMLEVCGD